MGSWSDWRWWTEDEKAGRTKDSGFYTTTIALPRLSHLPAASVIISSNVIQINLDPRASKVNTLGVVAGRLRDDGRVGVVDRRGPGER